MYVTVRNTPLQHGHLLQMTSAVELLCRGRLALAALPPRGEIHRIRDVYRGC